MTVRRKALFAAFVLGLVFSAAEAGLRIAGYQHRETGLDLQFFGPEFHEATRGEKDHYRVDPYFFWEPNPGVRADQNLDRHNEDGFRALDAELLAELPDEALSKFGAQDRRALFIARERTASSFRIACLGDSCTYGIGFGRVLRFPETYPGQLWIRLNLELTGRRVEVINAGCAGYSILQGQRVLERKVLPYQPDVVTLYFGAYNDYTPAFELNDIERGKLENGGIDVPFHHRILRDVRIYQLLTDLLGRLGVSKKYASRPDLNQAFSRGETLPRVPIDEFRRIAGEMIDLCRARSVEVIIMTPPLPRATRERYPAGEGYAQAVRGIALEKKAPLLDLRFLFDEREQNGEQLFADFVHPNVEGMRVIASELADEIQKIAER